MNYINGQSRNQKTMLPEYIEDYIDEDNPVRVIDAFVDSLDLIKEGFIRAIPKNTGRPGYDPRDLLKLYVYGYFNKIRSSRKLEQECHRNLELIYLLRKLTPDFRTISDFRKDNSKAMKSVFNAFVKLCMKLGLYQKELIAIDGSKFRAVNSKDNCYNEEVLLKKINNIDNHITEFLIQMDAADNEEESVNTKMSLEKIKSIVEELTLRKEKYNGYLEQLKSSGETQILTTDPDARRMHSKDGFHCCYNVQTAVDKGSHLIAEFEVTNHNTDQGLLNEVAQSTKEMLETKVIEVVADKGYESREDILKCIENGVIPNVALKYDKEEKSFPIEYIENQIDEETKNSTKPEDIQKCIHAGILPACYEGTNISIELQCRSELSCFIKNEDGTVTCPMGNTLTKIKNKGNNEVYASKEACRQCKNRCTSSRSHKTVSFGPESKIVPVVMYGSGKYKLNPVPTELINPNNHTLYRKKDIKEKIVIVTVKEDKHKIKERMCLSEHPFGTIKWYHGAHYVLCKGFKKATAEISLSMLAYNIRRAINMVGIDKIMEVI